MAAVDNSNNGKGGSYLHHLCAKLALAKRCSYWHHWLQSAALSPWLSVLYKSNFKYEWIYHHIHATYRYDKDFRKTVGETVPGAEAVIKVALMEEPPFKDLTESFKDQYGKVKATIEDISDSVGSVKSTVTSFFGGKKAPELKPTSSTKSEPKNENSNAPSEKKEAAPSAKSETKTVANPEASAPPPKAPKPQVTPLPQNVVELEKEIEVSAQLAIKQYSSAISVLKKFV